MTINEYRDRHRNVNALKTAERYGERLWHYTDVIALNGILNNKEIWFGSAANMNDKEELKGFIKELKKEVFSAIEGHNKESKSEEVFKKIQEELEKGYPYIFCVSQASDDAAQWERYANGGQGYAIVFNTEALYKITYDGFTLDKEFYVCSAKEHKLKDILVKYILTDEWEEFSDLDGYIGNLLLCANIHKHKSFSAEKEVRISPLCVEENDEKLQYKLLKSIRRVYVANLKELCEKERTSFEDLIAAIVIGPKSEQNIEDLKWYLKKIGHPQLINKIEKSECPFGQNRG